MTHITCRLTAKNRDQFRNATLDNRVWATFTFYTGLLHTEPPKEHAKNSYLVRTRQEIFCMSLRGLSSCRMQKERGNS